MNSLCVSFFGGLTALAVTFALCFTLVAGIKYLLLILKSCLTYTPPKKTVKRRAPVKRKPVRSIEINPEEVDRIYVKKT